MGVDETVAMHTAQHNGWTYHFCAPLARKSLKPEPEMYLDPEHQAHM
jgi:YHS domain-containing protein